MLHAVFPVFYQALLEELVLIGGQRVLELPGIRHSDLLIPTFASNGFLAFERCELRHGHIDVGEGDGKRGVLRALRYVGCGRQAPFRPRKRYVMLTVDDFVFSVNELL